MVCGEQGRRARAKKDDSSTGRDGGKDGKSGGKTGVIETWKVWGWRWRK